MLHISSNAKGLKPFVVLWKEDVFVREIKSWKDLKVRTDPDVWKCWTSFRGLLPEHLGFFFLVFSVPTFKHLIYSGRTPRSSLLSTPLSCACASTLISTHGFYFSRFHSSLAPHPRPRLVQNTAGSWDSPCVASPSSSSSSAPSPECLDRSKWCDCEHSAGRLPQHVCLSAPLETLTWAGRRGTEQHGSPPRPSFLLPPFSI